MKYLLALAVFLGACTIVSPRDASAAAHAPRGGQGPGASPPVYLWLEPEWFPGVKGKFRYWTGEMKASGAWGVAGPGITAEFSQGGESEWNSMAVTADETSAKCQRAITVPRAGHYRMWVRYVDHRSKTEPFTARVVQDGQNVISGELGVQPLVPPNDEYMLYWGFSFGWAPLEGELKAGPATIQLVVDKAGEAWRQVDALLLTDDLAYEPIAREKPKFAYESSFDLSPANGAAWRGAGASPNGFGAGSAAARQPVAGREFAMWTVVKPDPEWWGKQNLATLGLYDVLFQFSPPEDIIKEFQKQFEGKRDIPVLSWKGLLPGLYMGTNPDLSPGSPVRQWLEQTKTPFFLQTNYASPTYDEKNGPATYQALAGPLAQQFMGFIHGEALGTVGVPGLPETEVPNTRREYVDLLAKHLRKSQAEQWSAVFKTDVPDSLRDKGIACLSTESIALAHLFARDGAQVLGYELDATMSHAPMRIAFERGAARQFGKSWINYASGNFGDACNMFTQDPVVARGAKGWFHSKYAVTDGVPIAWYRAFYYLNYLSGASAIFWEQSLRNQWMLPGPGKHLVQLSPFGRATEDFQAFVDRLPDRGEPYAPVAILLSYGHGYDPINYSCKMFDRYPQNEADRELRALLDVCWHPAEMMASRPITPELQSLPAGGYGNIFDVLVDRPEKASAINDYPIVWAAGDVELAGEMAAPVKAYLEKGGTLVVNVEAARGKLDESVLGVKLIGKRRTCQQWTPGSDAPQAATPYEIEEAQPTGAQVLASAEGGVPLLTRQAVGKGAVILVLVPHGVGLDERAHPVLPWLMNGLTEKLLPVEVGLADGSRPAGQVMYQLNRTKTGWLVMLLNDQGIDKTQTGIARVNRREFRDVVLRTESAVKSAREMTQPRELKVETSGSTRSVQLRVHPGDVQVVELVTQ